MQRTCCLTFPCQVDCPDDVATYIHRVGRTARFNASGRSLLLLLPSERAMLPALEAAKIPVKVTKVRVCSAHCAPAAQRSTCWCWLAQCSGGQVVAAASSFCSCRVLLAPPPLLQQLPYLPDGHILRSCSAYSCALRLATQSVP